MAVRSIERCFIICRSDVRYRHAASAKLPDRTFIRMQKYLGGRGFPSSYLEHRVAYAYPSRRRFSRTDNG
jgi:hypothetical protein